MKDAASNLEFENAANLRDEIRRLEAFEIGLSPRKGLKKASGKVWEPRAKKKKRNR